MCQISNYQPDDDHDDGLNCLRGVLFAILAAMLVAAIVVVVKI